MTHSPARPDHHAAPAPRDSRSIWYLIALAVVLIAAATWAWGLPALAMAALAAVPVVFALLLLITRG